MATYIAHYQSPKGSYDRERGLFEFESDARAGTKANAHDARMKMLELFGASAVSWTIEKVERAGAAPAAKREKNIEFAVASAYHLPLVDRSVDVLLNCFSPLALAEFHRVLKPGGYFFYVVPGAEHLWEMKEILYDRPYPNEERETPYEGFAYEAIVPVEGDITLPTQTDIQNLFRMTPYAWKTPRSGKERLAALNTLTTRIAFRVHVFRRDDKKGGL